VTIDELEGRKRRDLEERLIAEDARKHKERKENDLPGLLAQQAAQQEGAPLPSRRFKMMLPAPALPEEEYAQVCVMQGVSMPPISISPNACLIMSVWTALELQSRGGFNIVNPTI
jgi:hypothetical protein